MSFLTRIKKDLSSREGMSQSGKLSLVDTRSLLELIHHFEAFDSAARADQDTKSPILNRTHCLVLEIMACFHNLGAEETIDIFMMVMAEIAEKDGVLEEDESKIIKNLMRFDEVRAKDI